MSRARLGQHFLIRGRTLERIAAAACPSSEPLVVEIGPGKGALTRHLLRRCARLIAIEIDPVLAAELRARFAAEPKLEIVHADALQLDWAQWGPAVVAGNLPYYAATPILEQTWRRPAVRRAVYLIQKEVASRVTARPGSRDYGALSVEAQWLAEVDSLFDVPPEAFAPPPKVWSTVIRIRPRPPDPPAADLEAFLRFVRRCFHQKRKTLRNNLRGAFPPESIRLLPEAGLRAEQLSRLQFAELYRRLVGWRGEEKTDAAHDHGTGNRTGDVSDE